VLARAASQFAWREFLDRSGPDIDADVATLKLGVASSSAAVREATIWFIVSALAGGRRLPIADLATVLRSPDVTSAAAESEWAAFGRELLARRFAKTAPHDGSGSIQRYALANALDARALGSVPELTSAERSALREVFPDLSATRRVPALRSVNATPAADLKSGPLPMRTFRSVAPGFLSSLLSATGCAPPSNGGAFGAARISYQSDGRPRTLALDTAALQPACARFIKSLAGLTVPDLDQPIVDGVPHWLLLAMDKETINCADEISVAAVDPERMSGDHLKPPQRIKDVRPIYPESMRQARVSGTVILESTLSPTGCPSSVKVLKSVAIPLDLAALGAVSGWRFSPTVLDGKPVPVLMTVSVNFTLQ
jgi:TonB family protein